MTKAEEEESEGGREMALLTRIALKFASLSPHIKERERAEIPFPDSDFALTTLLLHSPSSFPQLFHSSTKHRAFWVWKHTSAVPSGLPVQINVVLIGVLSLNCNCLHQRYRFRLLGLYHRRAAPPCVIDSSRR